MLEKLSRIYISDQVLDILIKELPNAKFEIPIKVEFATCLLIYDAITYLKLYLLW